MSLNLNRPDSQRRGAINSKQNRSNTAETRKQNHNYTVLGPARISEIEREIAIRQELHQLPAELQARGYQVRLSKRFGGLEILPEIRQYDGYVGFSIR